jgi:hypothetical protein
MERDCAKPSLHDLVSDALTRAARAQDESRMALDAMRATTDALEQTVAQAHYSRAARQRERPAPRHAPG